MIDFTKGKWTVDTSYSTMLLVSVEANIICQIDCDTYNFETSAVEPSDKEIANAHLIAAAPEMYRLLERLTDHKNYKKDMIHLLGEADSLLARARGE